MASPSFTANQLELAEVLRVSAKTIQQWDREGLRDAARLETGRKRESRYDLVRAFWWFHEREVRRVTAEADGSELDAAKLRKLQAEADAKELELAEKRGELVPLDEVEDLVRESLEAVDSVLRHSPSRFAPSLAKSAKVSVKVARTLLRDLVESVRGAIREGGAPTERGADAS